MISYKRGCKDSTLTSERMTWTSRCGKYKVQQCHGLFEDLTVYYALVMSDEGWLMLFHMKTYRTRRAAERVLEAHLKSKPKRKRPTK